MYRALAAPNVIPQNYPVWRLKMPLKIKIFTWYLIKNVALTKDNLAKKAMERKPRMLWMQP